MNLKSDAEKNPDNDNWSGSPDNARIHRLVHDEWLDTAKALEGLSVQQWQDLKVPTGLVNAVQRRLRQSVKAADTHRLKAFGGAAIPA